MVNPHEPAAPTHPSISSPPSLACSLSLASTPACFVSRLLPAGAVSRLRRLPPRSVSPLRRLSLAPCLAGADSRLHRLSRSVSRWRRLPPASPLVLYLSLVHLSLAPPPLVSPLPCLRLPSSPRPPAALASPSLPSSLFASPSLPSPLARPPVPPAPMPSSYHASLRLAASLALTFASCSSDAFFCPFPSPSARRLPSRLAPPPPRTAAPSRSSLRSPKDLPLFLSVQVLMPPPRLGPGAHGPLFASIQVLMALSSPDAMALFARLLARRLLPGERPRAVSVFSFAVAAAGHVRTRSVPWTDGHR